MDFTKLKHNLQKNGFQVSVFENARSAAEYLDREIDGMTVGMGGSVTMKQMDLYRNLSAHNDVFSNADTPGRTREEISRDAQTADIYLSSLNGISENGELINIDGTGNRVSAIQYGHKKVYLIAGRNKVAKDYESALYRARNIAGPLNARRLGKKTPCAVKGDKCYDCSSPERICRGLSVLWKKPGCCEYEVILIDEELGY